MIIGEFLCANAGLGYLIIYASQVFKMDLLVMSIVILCLLSTCLYQGIAWIEKKAALLARAALFWCHRKLRPMTQKRSAGCALARRRNMSQATALGARMCQGTFFFIISQSIAIAEAFCFQTYWISFRYLPNASCQEGRRLNPISSNLDLSIRLFIGRFAFAGY